MGRLTFPAGSRVYLDAAPIIYSVEKNPDYWQSMQELWLSADAGEIGVVTSELSLLEVLVHPVREKNYDLIRDYENLLLTSDVQLVPVTTSILKSAADLRADLNLKTPDAIHAATALASECDHLVANDIGFRRLSAVQVTILGDLLKAGE